MTRHGAARARPTTFSCSVSATPHNGSATSRSSPLVVRTFWQGPGSVCTQSGRDGVGDAVVLVRVGVVLVVRVKEVLLLPLDEEVEEEEEEKELGPVVDVLSVVGVETLEDEDS